VRYTFKEFINNEKIVPMIGVYDVFSAEIAAMHFETIFCSGYGFAASYYGLPDEGYIAWPDMVSYTTRLRSILPPNKYLIVDIDDGYGDPNLASYVASKLEQVGADGLIIEDQRRPKKCGHLPGKEILELDVYLERLRAVINITNNLYIIARTDTSDFKDALNRVKAFVNEGADAVLVDGLDDINKLPEIKAAAGKDIPITVNIIEGGKTSMLSFSDLKSLGVSLINYSTPCLFSAHKAIDDKLKSIKENDGQIIKEKKGIDLKANNGLLKFYQQKKMSKS
jgi:2-methylisocitrate lyase-like PEP mutase family enzyme